MLQGPDGVEEGERNGGARIKLLMSYYKSTMDQNSIALLAFIGIGSVVLYSASLNRNENFEKDVYDWNNHEYDQRFEYLRSGVQGNLTGPPGISAALRREVQNFLNEYAAYRADVPETMENEDIIKRYEHQTNEAQGWLERDSQIKSRQKELVREMNRASTNEWANAPRLSELVPTSNERMMEEFNQQKDLYPRPPDPNMFTPGAGTSIARMGLSTNVFDRYENDGRDQMQYETVALLENSKAPLYLDDGPVKFMQLAANPSELELQANNDMQIGFAAPQSSPAASVVSSLGSIPKSGTWSPFAGSVLSIEAPADKRVAVQRPPHERQVAVVQDHGFNVQPNFNPQRDPQLQLQERTRQNAKSEFESGNLQKSVVLFRQADIMRDGVVGSPDRPVPTIPEQYESPGGTVVSTELMEKYTSIERSMDATSSYDDLFVYINQLDNTFPQEFAEKQHEWKIPAQDSEVKSRPEWRMWARVRQHGQLLMKRYRPRSYSFDSPSKVDVRRMTKTYRGSAGQPQAYAPVPLMLTEAKDIPLPEEEQKEN